VKLLMIMMHGATVGGFISCNDVSSC